MPWKNGGCDENLLENNVDGKKSWKQFSDLIAPSQSAKIFVLNNYNDYRFIYFISKGKRN